MPWWQEMLTLLIICFVTGFLVKLVDFFDEHRKKESVSASHVFGLFYGILIGYAVVFFPVIAPLWLGAVVGNAVYGKVDSRGHYTGFAVMAAFLLGFWDFRLNVLLALLFAAAAFADELCSSRKKHRSFFDRPFLGIAALVVSAVTFDFVPFLAIVLFDVAYTIAAFAVRGR